MSEPQEQLEQLPSSPLTRRAAMLQIAMALLLPFALAIRFVLDRAPDSDAALVGFPLDDAWIHLVYARAFSNGEGLAYNPGQLETGATSPLWVMLLSSCFLMKSLTGISIATLVKTLGVTLGAAEVALSGMLARRLTGQVTAGILATLLVALDPLLAFARVSGMEVPLATSLLLGGLLALHAQKGFLALLLFGLAPCARPELALVSALFGPFALLLVFRRSSGRSASDWARRGLALVVPLLPGLSWLVFCKLVSGRPMPATFYVKHGETSVLSALADFVPTVISLLADVPAASLGLGCVSAGLGAVAIVMRSHGRFDRALALATVSWPLVLLLGCIWAHNLSQPLAFYWYRYLAPGLPGFVLLVACGLSAAIAALRSANAPLRPSLLVKAVSVLALLGLCVTAVRTPAALSRRADLYAWNCQNIQEMEVALGRWIDQNLPKDAVVATVDAGAVRYFGHRFTLDLIGLNAHRLLTKGAASEVVRLRPSAFIVFPYNREFVPPWSSLHMAHVVQTGNYTICACDQATLELYMRGTPLSAR